MSPVTCPIGFVKIQQQVATKISLIECARKIYSVGRIKSFYRAFGLVMCMDGLGRGVYLLTYETSKMTIISRYYRPNETIMSNLNDTQSINQNYRAPVVVTVAAAVIAGWVSWLTVYPLDVIRSRMQIDSGIIFVNNKNTDSSSQSNNQSSNNNISKFKYRNSFDCFIKSYQEGGVRLLYRGLSFSLFRAGPVAGTILPLYEFMKHFFTDCGL